MKFNIIIPARFKSTRLPGKPLVLIAGIPMLQRTYEQCIKALPPHQVYVATEDLRIVEFCESENINVLLTSDDCLTGTDRVAEVSSKISCDYYINVQGDEPLMNPEDIIKIMQQAMIGDYEVYAGYTPIESAEDYNNTSIPKVVFNEQNELIYMSRAPIPHNKQSEFQQAWRQVCVYAFSKKALELLKSRSIKSKLESIEDIEILRFIEMGMKVKMIALSNQSIAVDHPEDILKVEEALSN